MSANPVTPATPVIPVKAGIQLGNPGRMSSELDPGLRRGDGLEHG
jgi:hypothetical protein